MTGEGLHTRTARVLLGLWAGLVIAFLFGPIAVVAAYAFNASNVQSWPIPGFSLRWFAAAWEDREIAASLSLSLRAGATATALATVIGTAAALAVHRYRFVGREAVSLVLVLPIALPGVITGMALNSFFTLWGLHLSFWTIVVGHATFCIVVVYSNPCWRGCGVCRPRWPKPRWTSAQMAGAASA